MAAWAAWAIPLITSAIGSALSSKRQSGFDPRAADRAFSQLTHSEIYGGSNWLFPGLLADPNKRPVPTVTRSLPTGGNVTRTVPTGTGPKGPYTPRAMGGPVESGEDYMVGEQGPELFRPKQDGAIIPNPQTMGGMPGGGGQGGGGEMDQLIQVLAAAIAEALMQVFRGGQGGGPMGGGMMGGDMEDMMEGQGGGMGMPMAGPPGRQFGGPVRKGQTYRVGEQGPEAFAPTQPIGQPAQTNNYQYPGEGYVGSTMEMFNKPGQLSPATYHREQEQANQAQNQMTQSIQGGLTGAGLDPNSPMGQSLQLAGTAATSKMRAESARDYSLAQDQLKRQDLAMAATQYLNALNTIFGLQTNRAAAYGGQGYPQAPPIYPYSGIGTGLATFGYEYAKGQKSKSSDTGKEGG